MRVLITGTGFLGSAILSYLLKNTKHDVFTISRSPNSYYQHLECDLLDVPVLKRTLEEIQPELIFHTAGIAITKPDDENPSFILRNNIEGLNNLVHNLKNCPRFVFASSATVYGDFSKEYPPNWMSFVRPISLYATSKLAGEYCLRAYKAQGRVDPVSIRIPALCGVGSTHGLLFDLFRKVESDSPTLDLIGNDPGSIKPFCRVDEIAELFYKIGIGEIGYDEIGLTCLVGNTDSPSVKTVAELVMRELGKKKEIRWSGQSWPGDNPQIYLNPCLKPKSNSTESILQTIKEYKLAKNNKL